MFCEKDALKNFAILQGKHLCWSLFLIKLHLESLFNEVSIKFHKKRKCFSMNVAKVLITHTYFEEHLQTATSVQMQQWFPVANAYETKNGYRRSG